MLKIKATVNCKNTLENKKTVERLELAKEHLLWSGKYGEVVYGSNETKINSFLTVLAIVSKRIYICFIA